jgi:hypothetical protein
VIVTYNLKDFPTKVLAPMESKCSIRTRFLTHLLDLAPRIVLAALQRLRQSLKNPPIAIENYLTVLEQHELPSFVAKLREFQSLLRGYQRSRARFARAAARAALLLTPGARTVFTAGMTSTGATRRLACCASLRCLRSPD